MSNIVEDILVLKFHVENAEALDKIPKSMQAGQQEIAQLHGKLAGLKTILSQVSDANKKAFVSSEIEKTEQKLAKLNSEYKIEIGLVEKLKSEISTLNTLRDQATTKQEVRSINESLKLKQASLQQLQGNAGGNDSFLGGGIGGALGKIGLAGAGLQAIIGTVSAIADPIVNVTAKFETFEAVLTNALGSKSEAQQSLSEIKEFAVQTPFQVEELTESFVKLVNRGFKPTVGELTKLGDLAASQGKSFDQLTEALLDAQTGEFERLKEFGITASKEGDKVAFSFKGVKTQVDFNNQAIQKYILSLGELNGVQGLMAVQSKTLGGAISNLKDSFNALLGDLGKSSSGVIKGFVDGLSEAVGFLRELTKENETDNLKEQAVGFNNLVTSITQTNISNENRLFLLQRLKSEYPDFLKYVDLERISNEQLLSIVDKLNDAYKIRELLEQTRSTQAAKAARITDLENKKAEAIQFGAANVDGELTSLNDIENLLKQAKETYTNNLRDVSSLEKAEKQRAILQDQELLRIHLADLKAKTSLTDADKKAVAEDEKNTLEKIKVNQEKLRALRLGIEYIAPKQSTPPSEKATKNAEKQANKESDAIREAEEAIRDALQKKKDETAKLKADLNKKDGEETIESIKAKYKAELDAELAQIDKQKRELTEKLQKAGVGKSKINQITSRFGAVREAATENNTLQQEQDLQKFYEKQTQLIEKLDKEILKSSQKIQKLRDENQAPTRLSEIKAVDNTAKNQSENAKQERNDLLASAKKIANLEKRTEIEREIEQNYQDELTEITKDAAAKRAEINIKYAEKDLLNELETFRNQQVSDKITADNELTILEDKHTKGLISTEKYEEEKTRLKRDAAIKGLLLEKSIAENELAVLEQLLKDRSETLTKAQKEEYQKRIEALQSVISGLNLDISINLGEQKNENDPATKIQKRLSEIQNAYNELAGAITQANDLITQSEQERTNRQIQIQEQRVEAAAKIADKGNAEALQREQTRLDKLHEQQERQQQRQARLNAIIQAGNSVLTISNLAVGVSKAFKEGNPILGIAQSIAIAATFAATILSLKNTLKGSTQGFKHGTRYLDGNDFFSGEQDSLLIRAQRGERIVTKENNAKYGYLFDKIERGELQHTKSYVPIRPNYDYLMQQNEAHKTQNLQNIIAQTVKAEVQIYNSKLHEIAENTSITATEIARASKRPVNIANYEKLAESVADRMIKNANKWK